MKGGIFGFSRREVLWFATFFIISIGLVIFCGVKLISKYYNHSVNSSSRIKSSSHDLWTIQDMNLFAINIQRGSLNLIVYATNTKERETTKIHILRNRDSLSHKFAQMEAHNQLDTKTRTEIIESGRTYLRANSVFISLVTDATKKESPEEYNVRVMRPTLHKFTDLIHATGKALTRHIQQTTDSGLNIFHQYEFWILIIMLLPYIYFFFRFLYLVIKMIVWDFSS
ncbi:MAG TPA: hypothetical protein VNY73_01320 [Bacteroidia bacterium]|jgi:hypothetical protein|nr:hypothetical protein [Bacteroidia bacterium]